MKILLTAINSKYIHSNLAVYSLKACAGDYKTHVEIVEFTINNRKDDILFQIYKQKPNVLCFSCYIWNIEYVDWVSREFHKICPDVPIWLGGPEVSFETEVFLRKHTDIAGVMIGEGEQTFKELCAYYSDGKGSLRQIRGIAFRNESNEIIFTEARQAMDMNEIAFCYDKTEDFSNRIVYYESSRGCPFSCSYCLSSVDKRLRFKNLDMIKRELRFFIDNKVPQVKFVDRTFNCNHEHAAEIWKFIKEHDNGVTNFHFEVSADLINEDELALMKDMRPRLIQLEIGVQSVNEATISEIHRTMNLERLKEVVRKIQKGGNIHEHLDLIAGLPYEDYASFKRSFDEIYALKPNQLQLGFLKLLKGSYMYEHAGEYGILYQDAPPYEVLSTKWLSFEEVLRIKQVEEMLEVYYNSGQFEVTLKILDRLFDSAFDMFYELGCFYESHGYSEINHSRIRRCEILLQFLEEKFEGLKGMLEEALTFDLYYRENCKSRPKWAPNPLSFKEMTHTYCKNGKMTHIEPFHYHFPKSDIRTILKLPEYTEKPVWALFHYDKRNPLDNQALIEYL